MSEKKELTNFQRYFWGSVGSLIPYIIQANEIDYTLNLQTMEMDYYYILGNIINIGFSILLAVISIRVFHIKDNEIVKIIKGGLTAPAVFALMFTSSDVNANQLDSLSSIHISESDFLLDDEVEKLDTWESFKKGFLLQSNTTYSVILDCKSYQLHDLVFPYKDISKTFPNYSFTFKKCQGNYFYSLTINKKGGFSYDEAENFKLKLKSLYGDYLFKIIKDKKL